MKRVCKICNLTYTPRRFWRDVRKWSIDVCSLNCLQLWLQQQPVKEFDPSICYKTETTRPFQSHSEEVIFHRLSKNFEVYYEPYIFVSARHTYIPDLYIKDKNLFIELKGNTQRITKFKHFARKYPIYILFTRHLDLQSELQEEL